MAKSGVKCIDFSQKRSEEYNTRLSALCQSPAMNDATFRAGRRRATERPKSLRYVILDREGPVQVA